MVENTREDLQNPELEMQAVLDQARQLHQAGKLDAAETLCQQILAQQPANAHALYLLATVAYQKGNLARAETLARQMLATTPDESVFHFFLGNVLRDLGRPREAAASLRTAVRLNPKFPQALNNLGNVLKTLGQPGQAVACFRRAVELKPDYALAYYNLGNTFRELKRVEPAIACFRRALRIKPNYYDALNNLGNVFKDLYQLDEAVACYERALKIKPDVPEVLNNLGGAMKDQNRLEAAAAAFKRAIDIAPDFGDAHFGYGIVLLTLGDYLRGWREYEWRWKAKDFPAQRWTFSEPLWNGEELGGRTLLLHYEQGYGDNIQLLRYVPLVCEKGGRVILELQKPLIRLAQTLRSSAEIIPAGSRRPPFDLRCSLISLPRVFRTTIDTIPGPVPYLSPDPVLVARWRERLANGDGLKVGLVWAGNPKQATETKRGIGLAAYRPLFSLKGIRWFSLQVGPRAGDVSRLPAGLIEDLSGDLTDFAETAAAVANLDLVITTDTAVGHLAGAIGHPIWIMLRWAPDWRWGLAGSDNPWYPTARLFRQPQRDRWQEPVEQVRAALTELAAGGAAGRLTKNHYYP